MAAKNIVTNIERIVKTELPPEVKMEFKINFITNRAMTIDEIIKSSMAILLIILSHIPDEGSGGVLNCPILY